MTFVLYVEFACEFRCVFSIKKRFTRQMRRVVSAELKGVIPCTGTSRFVLFVGSEYKIVIL